LGRLGREVAVTSKQILPARLAAQDDTGAARSGSKTGADSIPTVTRSGGDEGGGTVRELRSEVINRWRDVPARMAVGAGAGLSAAVAAVFAAITTHGSHRVWGVLAAFGYLAAAATCCRAGYSAIMALRVAGIGAALLPAAALIGARVRQPEVDVVERSAQVLLNTGSPYLDSVTHIRDVNPYLPGMAVFGLPRQLLGDSILGDARLWFFAVFVAALATAAVLARAVPSRAPVPSAGSVAALLGTPAGVVWAVLACPVVALPVAVGGHDLPVVGLLCLGLVLAVRSQAVPAGFVLGVAAVLKQSAWPGVAVSVTLLVVLGGAAAAWRCAVIAVAALAAVLLLVLLGPTGSSMLRQIAGFPLAVSKIVSPASNPTPGVLLASAGPTAHFAGLALLAGAVLGLAVWLLRSRPRDLSTAVTFLALTETIAALVLPTSRWGYAVYPAVLLLWATSLPMPPPRLSAAKRRPTSHPHR
jgi:glycosyl transferase family 87